MPNYIIIAFLTFLSLLPIEVHASEKVTGSFEAIRACEAYKSFRHGRNPGQIVVSPGQIYEAREINEKNWSWIQIEIPGIQYPYRWVPKECGISNISDQTPPEPGPTPKKECNKANTYDSNVLAITWQPGFCEHYNYNGTKKECDALEDGEIVINHLTLHGLWPNKNVCNKSYGYCSETPMDLSDETIIELAPWMPNFLYENKFGEYEWKKHGTCQEREDDKYFLLAKRLVEKIDNSPIGSFIKGNIGNDVKLTEFKEHITSQMGEDVVKRIQIKCSGRKYLQEILINLPKEINEGPTVSDIVRGASTFSSFENSCDQTIHIEESGIQ